MSEDFISFCCGLIIRLAAVLLRWGLEVSGAGFGVLKVFAILENAKSSWLDV